MLSFHLILVTICLVPIALVSLANRSIAAWLAAEESLWTQEIQQEGRYATGANASPPPPTRHIPLGDVTSRLAVLAIACSLCDRRGRLSPARRVFAER